MANPTDVSASRASVVAADGVATTPPVVDTTAEAVQRQSFVARDRRAAFSARLAPHSAVLGAALALWAVSLTATDLDKLSGFGLLAALPPSYYVALALLTLGFAVAAAAKRLSERLLAAYVVALAILLHATAPLLYDYPRYSWTYKHLGVIGYIQANGAVDRSIDIYHSWPGFFAANAWLSKATGVSAMTYAGWAQLFFELINVAVLVFALRGITRDVRVIWVAAWLFLLANWVGQDYLAPQAFGFVMALLIIGLCLRCATIPRRPRTAVARWIDRQLRRIPGLVECLHPRAPRPLPPAGAFVVGGICYLAVVVSHQLSPVMILAAVWTFALLTRRLPLWIPVAMTGVEAYWVALAWPFVSKWFRLFNPDPAASHPIVYDPSRALHGVELVRYGSWLLTVVLVVVAAAGLLLRLRGRRFEVLPLALAAAPLVVFFLQSYGGEAVFRTYLFALPWLVFFAAAACVPSTAPHVRVPVRLWRFVAVAAVTTPCLLLAYFGYEKANYFTGSDVAAARWWEQHAPRHSALGLVAPNYPSRLTGRYAYARISGAPALTDEGGVRYRAIRRSDLRGIVRMLDGVGGHNRNRYLAITPSQERFSDLYGLLPPGSFARLRYLLGHSPQFRIVYSNGQAEIYKFRIVYSNGQAEIYKVVHA
jgi:hypothetical protein